VITFFGVLRADDTLIGPSGTTETGVPIYERPDFGFSLVVEARPGGSRAKVGDNTFNYNPSDPNVLPDLLIEASRQLGNGSPAPAVCDDTGSTAGGVPAVDPPDFSISPFVSAAINDLACRFKDGSGAPGGRSGSDACVLFPDGLFHLVCDQGQLGGPLCLSVGSTEQFCAQVDKPISFPEGDATLTVRVRDLAGFVSKPAQIVIRVAPQ
jgi:hypothetical protein